MNQLNERFTLKGVVSSVVVEFEEEERLNCTNVDKVIKAHITEKGFLLWFSKHPFVTVNEEIQRQVKMRPCTKEIEERTYQVFVALFNFKRFF